MGGLEKDTIGGFNAFIEEQKKVDGEAQLTTILFDGEYEMLHQGVNLKDVRPLTTKEYFARGMTALLDAVGKTINSVGARLSAMAEEDRPAKVIFAITTDGEENASQEFSYPQIKAMIEHQTTKYDWQFLFLGANIDAAKTARNLGIGGHHSAQYTANANGTKSIYMAMSVGVAGMRGCQGSMGDPGAVGNWKENIQ